MKYANPFFPTMVMIILQCSCHLMLLLRKSEVHAAQRYVYMHVCMCATSGSRKKPKALNRIVTCAHARERKNPLHTKKKQATYFHWGKS